MSGLGWGVWIIMALCENDADVEPGGGYEAAEWGTPGWGDCCRDWNPFRMWFSDWAAGRVAGLSFRDDDGPALQWGRRRKYNVAESLMPTGDLPRVQKIS